MKILGIGTDIVNIKRINKSLKLHNNKFKKRIFSSNEINYCERKKNSSSFYAKRFAAKEAVGKALGTGISNGFDFKNIEIFNDKLGKPFIKLKGNALLTLKRKVNNKKFQIDLSLSDDSPWAQATVIISYKK